MYFVIIGIDRPGSEELRLRTRPSHREHLHAARAGLKLRLAGPLTSPDGASMIGSLIIVEATDLAIVEAFSRADPYRQVDLFAEVSIRAWNWTSGNPDTP